VKTIKETLRVTIVSSMARASAIVRPKKEADSPGPQEPGADAVHDTVDDHITQQGEKWHEPQ